MNIHTRIAASAARAARPLKALPRVCSYSGVKPGEIFRVIEETLHLHPGVMIEERNGNVIKFRKELRTGRPEVVKRVNTYDKRTYVRASEGAHSVCMENAADAVFGNSDKVQVISHIDDEWHV